MHLTFNSVLKVPLHYVFKEIFKCSITSSNCGSFLFLGKKPGSQSLHFHSYSLRPLVPGVVKRGFLS